MKKSPSIFLTALALCLATFAPFANAGEFKPFGHLANIFVYGNSDAPSRPSDEFEPITRLRFGFDYVQDENLSATIEMQYGPRFWATNVPDFTGDPDANLAMRLGYIDFKYPQTDLRFRFGRQALVLPSYAFSSAILDGRGDAVSVATNISENVSAYFAFAKINSDIDSQDPTMRDKDAHALIATTEFKYDTIRFAPWAMYVHAEKNGAKIANLEARNSDSIVLGASVEFLMFSPFKLSIDALYNYINAGQPNTGVSHYDGFFIAGNASYTLDNGVVALKGWYSTGDDKNNNTNDFIILDGKFCATTMMFGDNNMSPDAYATLTNDTPMGTLGLVAEYANFSIIEKLNHTARIAYIQGTNENIYTGNTRETTSYRHLYDDDKIVEINFNSYYPIYKNLLMGVEFGYMFVDMANLSQTAKAKGVGDDIFRSAMHFTYFF